MNHALFVVELGEATAISLGPAAVLVDCPEGTWAAWNASSLRATGPDAVALTSGRAEVIAGLYGLLAGMAAAGRTEPVRLLHHMADGRPGNLVGAYLQSEPVSFPVSLEGDWPGAVLMVGGLRLESRGQDDGRRWAIEGGGRRVER
ncbi:MAG TPA: hypothetical protein QGF58_28400 [Myxococcota bacterium]|nr:hypothetical protein [Myxococcota bacterium]